ncbi:MAG TPA: sugar ABC transporter ATP-binding protein [Pyrinomonadaceae bacterium]|nr:sugar ABC transporter ATP-binding protein [Pyrinomonadaceae bacterium]
MAPLLKLQNIHKRFGPTVALAGVDLNVDHGEVHAIIGENGAGKSTLMNIISGVTSPDDGEIRIDESPFCPAGPLDARAAGIAYIHQELLLCPHLTVAENILLGTESANAGWLRRDAMRTRAGELLESFGRADISPESRVDALPLASQQIVEICRALAWRPKLILMDEPTSSLERGNIERLFAAIRRLKASGVAIIYISHFLEEVREIADRFTVLRDGISVQGGDLTSVSDDQLIEAMVGRSVEIIFEHQRSGAREEILLSVRDLSSPPMLQTASFDLHRGEVLGIAGLVGSGRTSLVRALFGLERPVRGEIRVSRSVRSPTVREGKAVADAGASGTPHERIMQGIGFVSEDRKNEGLALPLTLADNITLTRFELCATAGWISQSRQDEQAKQCMQKLKVRAFGPAAKVSSLSGGNQQKVALGRLLHQDPDILLLDEPTRGIDVGSKADLYAEISRLAESGKGIIMVSSYLPELFGICDRIAVMNRGRLSEARPVNDWTPQKVMEAAIATHESLVRGPQN